MSDQSSQVKADKKAMDQAALVHFVDDLIKERKDPNITPETLPAVRALLLRELNTDINTHMVNLLTDDQKKELDALLNKMPTDDELNKFFVERTPNADIEIAKVMVQFRAAYLGLVPAAFADDKAGKETTLPPAPVDTPLNSKS